MSISITANVLPIAPAARGKGMASIKGDAAPKNPFQMLYADMLKSRGHPVSGPAEESKTEKTPKASTADNDVDKPAVANSTPAIPAVPLDSQPGTSTPAKAETQDATTVTASTPGNEPFPTIMQPIVLQNISVTPPGKPEPAPTLGDAIRPTRNGDKSSAGAATSLESRGAPVQGPADTPAKEGELPAAGFSMAIEGASPNAHSFLPASVPPEGTSIPVATQAPELPSTGTAATPTILTQAQPPVAVEPAARELELRAHPSSPVWREGFAAQVNVLVGERVQSAEMRVHPPELGPIEIRIVTVDQQTNIVFTASHEDTRRAIEDAMPRLREVLAESGVNLDSTSVNSDRPSGDTHRQAHSDAGRTSSQAEPGVTETQIAMAPQRRLEGLIDTFA